MRQDQMQTFIFDQTKIHKHSPISKGYKIKAIWVNKHLSLQVLIDPDGQTVKVLNDPDGYKYGIL